MQELSCLITVARSMKAVCTTDFCKIQSRNVISADSLQALGSHNATCLFEKVSRDHWSIIWRHRWKCVRVAPVLYWYPWLYSTKLSVHDCLLVKEESVPPKLDAQIWTYISIHRFPEQNWGSARLNHPFPDSPVQSRNEQCLTSCFGSAQPINDCVKSSSCLDSKYFGVITYSHSEPSILGERAHRQSSFHSPTQSRDSSLSFGAVLIIWWPGGDGRYVLKSF